MTKPTKWHVQSVKTQISLGIHPVWSELTQISLGIYPAWSESSLSAWRKLRFLNTHWTLSEDVDQTVQMPRLIWVFAGWQVILLVLSRGGLSFLTGRSWQYRHIIIIIISILEPCFPLLRVGLFDKSFSKASSPLRTVLRVSRIHT